jgi:hypothetical protein
MDKAKALRIIAQGIEAGYRAPINVSLSGEVSILVRDNKDWRTWASAFGMHRSDSDRSSEHMPEGLERVIISGSGVEVVYHRPAASEAAKQAALG